MFLNQSPASRQQLAELVQVLRMTEPDVIAFAIQQLFEERVSRPIALADELPVKSRGTRRRLQPVV
jgi:hypothetical protein